MERRFLRVSGPRHASKGDWLVRKEKPMIPSPPDTRASLILRLPDSADAAAWDELLAIYGPLVFRIPLSRPTI